jgi:hypothetical protein
MLVEDPDLKKSLEGMQTVSGGGQERTKLRRSFFA